MKRSTPKVHWGMRLAMPATGTADHSPHIVPGVCAFICSVRLIAVLCPAYLCMHHILSAWSLYNVDQKHTCRLRVDSSSLMPPLRKCMPGTAGGMLRSIVRTVYLATSSGGGVGTSSPAAASQV